MTRTMVSAAETVGTVRLTADGGWLILRQLIGILRLELRRNLFSKQALALYLLAFGPALLMGVGLVFGQASDLSAPIERASIFALLFELYVRVSIFFSALLVFMSLFRSEILQRSLHYYFLTPVRREVLVLGKYGAALGSACATFAVSTALIYLLFLLFGGMAEAQLFLMRGPGMGHLLGYVGVAVLGCVGYGALFLLVGLLFRNPVIPAAVLWVWEFINFLLPPLLKKFSVIFYLRSLYPVPTEVGIFAVVAEPVPAWLSVPGLMFLTLVTLVVAGWRARRRDISYGAD